MFELGIAARAGDVGRVKTLLREGAQVNSRDSSERTALHYACESEHKDMQRVVDVLLEAGAEVNAQDVEGRTPLHVAGFKYNAIDLVHALLGRNTGESSKDKSAQNLVDHPEDIEKVCLVNLQNCEGNTALHLFSGINDKEVVCLLLRMGAKVGVKNVDGMTALHVAANASAQDVVNVLVDNGEDVNATDSFGDTPLHIASTTDSKGVVCSLLHKGAKVGVKNNKGKTALHKAAKESTVDIVNVLVDNGEDLNATSSSGITPLHIASRNVNKDVVRLLLRMGAKVGVKNNKGMTALHEAIKESTGDIVDILVDNGEDVNATDSIGDTPLHTASRKGNVEVVRLLLRMGAKLGVKNEMGMTPLHCAVSFSAREIVSVLVDIGEYVNAKDFIGNTPLHYLGSKRIYQLCSSGQSKTVLAFIMNFLIIRGAKIDEQNIYLETPYEHIVTRSEVRILDMEIVEESFITQVIRLRTLGQVEKFDINWTVGPDFYDNVSSRCYEELEDMKSIMVVKNISLYQVLSYTHRSFLLSTEDLLRIDEFLSSPDLLTRFPLYGLSLRITFQRANLLTLAVQSFYSGRRRQTVQELPYSVAEKLLNFLSNEDLNSFINSE